MLSENHFSDPKIRTEDTSYDFSIPPTKRTPGVYLMKDEGLLEISGRSIPNRANDFYFPVMRKVEEYIQSPAESTKVIFNLEYVDSSSSKLLLALIMRLKKLGQKYNLVIEWHYAEDDEDIFELGKTYSTMSGYPINFVEHM